MLRFLSRKKGRNGQKTSSHIKANNQRMLGGNKNVQCKVLLLDGTDLSIDLSVSIITILFVCVF